MSKRRNSPRQRDTTDFPEISDALLVRMRPSKRGRPPEGDTAKEAISLRVDKDVLAAYKAQGPGWQSRMHATLKRAASRMKSSAGSRKSA